MSGESNLPEMASPATDPGTRASADADDVACPRCGASLGAAAGPWSCLGCDTRGSTLVFAPPGARAVFVPGEGRCAGHATKDAVDACERCGAFVCDVCRTRTGELTLCPGCFDTLHARGELATTKSRRIRWDRLSVMVFVLAMFCSPFGLQVLTVPLAVGLAVTALWKSRTEPYLSRTGPIVVVTLAGLIAAGVVGLVLLGSLR